jgi:hypothetical protein
MTFRLQGVLQRQAEPPLPSIPAMAANAVQAARAVGRDFAATGRIAVDKATADRRASVCRGCDAWYRPSDERCSHPKCGCFLRLKRWLWAQTCPAGRW